MDSVALIAAHAASVRLAEARAFLRGLPERSRALILAPSLAAATSLCHDTLSVEALATRFGWFRRTLDMFAVELATPFLAQRGLSILRGVGIEALCARVAHELVESRALTRYAGVASRPGFVRALSTTLSELRMAAVTPEALSEHDSDLSRLLAHYEATLASSHLTDRAGLLVAAAEAVATTKRLPVGDPLLVLDAHLRHGLEARFLRGLCARAASGLVTVLRGDERTQALLGGGFALAEEPQRTDLDLVRTGLFAAATEGDAAVERGHVALLSSPGEGRELVEVVRRVLDAARAGVPFDRMAIVLRAPGTYRAVAEEALSRAQIPAHFADGVERPCPEGRALLSLLECKREDYSASAFSEYLSLGVMPLADQRGGPGGDAQTSNDATGENTPEGEEPVRSPRHWQRLLVDAAVMGGRARWDRRLRGLEHELHERAAELDGDDPRRERLGRDARALAALRAYALPILDELALLPESATWAEWLPALDRLARQTLAEPAHVREILSELAPLGPMGPISLNDVLRVLGRRLPTVLVRSEGPAMGKLFVGAIDDVLGRSFRHVFVPGLAEKLFPPRVLEDPLLPDAVRRVLSGELGSREEAARRERLLLRVAVGAASEHLTVSFPRFDLVHARPRVPSFYGLEILRALDGRLPAFDELSRRAHPGAAARMGFPAPERAEQAIDDAEYDLSMLDVLLRATPEEQRGAAVFLLRANLHLARALRFRARRWMLAKFTPADGFVASSDELKALARNFGVGQRAHSPSSLSALSACPYRFFLHAIMRLSPREEVEAQDELDARQRGILLHAVQRGVLTALREQGMLPVTGENLEAARQVLHAVFERETEQAREEFAPAIEGVFRDALRTSQADLEEWLRRLSTDRAFVPAFFELGFGVPRTHDLDASSRPDEIRLANGMLQRGVIDLVERAERDPHLLRATDYKTGQVPEKLTAVISGGRVLQPLLYALALEQLFPGHKVQAGRLYFTTADAGFAEHEVPLNEHTRVVARDFAESVDAMVTQGFLPAAPALKECERCAYQVVCGPYEELRVAQVKRGELTRLSPLFHLRALP